MGTNATSTASRRTLARAGLPLLAVALCLVLRSPAAGTAEITVLTAGAFKPVVEAVADAFVRRTGNRVRIVNDTAGALARRVERGEAFDVLVLPPTAFAELARTGRVSAEPPVELAKVGIGVAVREGAPRPDISTPDAFRRAVLDARAIAMIDPAAGGSSGVYLARLFERWGIAEQVRAKAVLVPGGLVATRVVSGEADLAIHQVSEILAVRGAVLVGPLPEEVQNYTVYAGSIAANTGHPDVARALLAELSGTEAAGVLRTKGMLPAGP